MNTLSGKRILIAVSGGIAAYKACELLRFYQNNGAALVAILMTPGATQFISPLTFETLSQHPVYLDHFKNTSEGIPEHIDLAQHFDVLVIAPCSANTLAKLAHGLADNLLTTTFLTFTDKPVVLAPAMNTRMWENPLTQDNWKRLKQLATVYPVEPASGNLACGETGIGKLADIEAIALTTEKALQYGKHSFLGQHVVVTAGGTEVAIDSVRYLTNRSSGKMGEALADVLYTLGATVTLLHANALLNKPYSTQYTPTVPLLMEATQSAFEQANGLIMAAAVSDYALHSDWLPLHNQKIKKKNKLDIPLLQGPDILATCAASKKAGQWIVGFAAESDTENALSLARAKMRAKKIDAIVLNDISRRDIGFASNENEVTFIAGEQDALLIKKASKKIIASTLLQCVHQYCLLAPENEIIESKP
jgi:phosphopantothenoylcysteine decarboxylase / phosphopantothenate---cysteine ligase